MDSYTCILKQEYTVKLHVDLFQFFFQNWALNLVIFELFSNTSFIGLKVKIENFPIICGFQCSETLNNGTMRRSPHELFPTFFFLAQFTSKLALQLHFL